MKEKQRKMKETLAKSQSNQKKKNQTHNIFERAIEREEVKKICRNLKAIHKQKRNRDMNTSTLNEREKREEPRQDLKTEQKNISSNVVDVGRI